jgi:hypothetical protein
VVATSHPATRRPRPGLVAAGRAVADAVVGGTLVLAAVLAAPLARRRYGRWGATSRETVAALPGDDLVPAPLLGYTRALTIAAPPARVWPWLVQVGHGRGGLYSYDGLENLFGCRMHSADAVLPEHQDLRAGDLVRLGPEGYPGFRVHDVRPPTDLVLVGASGGTAATWQWSLRPLDAGRTRLVVRQRIACPPRQRWMWRLVEPVGFVMEHRMLRGLRRRAERPR